ncbi:MAG: HAD-IIIA family hydrolase [Parasporobacterium sp.]|nr:HAD-IIIA family hydrolase [Parasporobacterium sp.]
MFEKFYPKEYLSSAYCIDYEYFYSSGYRGILFDIDNTLVKHDAPADERSIELFDKLRAMGFSTCLISNNYDKRTAPFAEAVSSSFLSRCHKPSPEGYLKACEIMGTDSTNTLMVGDQVFTDIWGANNAGIYSVLTKPIDKDPLFKIKLKRVGEKIVLLFYKGYSRRHKNTEVLHIRDCNNQKRIN